MDWIIIIHEDVIVGWEKERNGREGRREDWTMYITFALKALRSHETVWSSTAGMTAVLALAKVVLYYKYEVRTKEL